MHERSAELKIAVRRYLIFVGQLFLASVCAAQAGSFRHLDEANRLISIGDCSGAETYARANVQRPIVYTVLGMVQLDCRRNKRAAIQYLKTAALEDESLAREMLIELGEIPPDRKTATSAPPTAREYSLPQPPPYVSPAQQQQREQQTQQVIIQQQPMLNPNACIQDGGSIFCPNHPNTKIVPFKLR